VNGNGIGLASVPLRKINVRVIHSGGVNSNQRLACPRLRLRHFLQLQFLRSAIFCYSYRFHLTTSTSLSLQAERARVFLPGCLLAMRFDKLARKFLATVLLASTRLLIRAYVSAS